MSKNLQTVDSIEIGTTVDLGSLRVHRYRDHLVLWDLTNAGKRGKKVPRVSVSPSQFQDASALLDRVSKLLSSYVAFQQAVTTLKDLNSDTECLKFDYTEERGIDVRPAGVETIEFSTKYLSICVGPQDFCLKDLTDANNEPTAIPAINGGKRSIPALYWWMKANQEVVKTMKYRDLLANLRALGIQYHSYCAMD